MAAVLAATLLSTVSASADVLIHDKDGWRVYTRGLIAAHYQFIQGDGDPTSTSLLVGGRILNNVSQDENNELASSRVRSGFVGTQVGLGIDNQLGESLEASGFFAVNAAGIDNAKGSESTKHADIREAWAALGGRFGTFSFGRMFSIFGSASGEVNAYAFGYGVGHPCAADSANISCGASGAGPLYAGFNAQFRYASPRIAGFAAEVSLADPTGLPDYHITPQPRFDGELSYRATFASDGLLQLKGQGLVQKLVRLNEDRSDTVSTTAWGAMGAARFELSGFKAGGGAWTGKGMGTHVPLQQDNQANPLAHDKPGGGFPGHELRSFRGFFANLLYDYRGSALTVGGGAVFIQQTEADAAPDARLSLIRQNIEGHVVFTQRIHSVILTAEYMHFISEWYGGEKQKLSFFGAGANFVW
jgi:hypothetical protein